MIFPIPENLKKGVYKINLKEKTLTSIPAKIISDKFGVMGGSSS